MEEGLDGRPKVLLRFFEVSFMHSRFAAIRDSIINTLPERHEAR